MPPPPATFARPRTGPQDRPAAASQRHPPIALSDRPADAGSRRAALLVIALSAGIFIALAPLATMPLPQANWFIPLFQSVLIINDLVTAALLYGQLRLTRRKSSLVIASGYVFAALMASIHLLTFPGVFAPPGLLGAGAQTTGYLHVFWHLGLPLAVIAYTFIRERRQVLKMPVSMAIPAALGVVALLATGLTLLTTLGNDLLPPMLDGIRYSSAFNIGRYGSWAVTGLAALLLWQRRVSSVLDLWLIVMLVASFFEIALVGIFNAGRYDLGFYAGRIYAVLASCVVLLMLLAEHGKVYRELAQAHETAQSEAALRESREVLRLAMHGGRMAAWTRDLASGISWWSPEVEEITGWPAAALGASDAFFYERVHPQDRAAVHRALATAGPPQEEIAVVFRLRHADGHWRWLDARGQAPLDGDGRPSRLFGVVIDITAHKQEEQTRVELEARFHALADGMPQLAWMARPDGWIYWYNRRWYEYTGTTFEQVKGWGWQSVHDRAALPHTLERWRRSLETGEPFEMVFPLRGADGQLRPFLTRMSPLKDDHGRVLNWFGTNTDITRQREAEEALRVADRRKDEFIATLAHELRNPLAPIRTAVDLLGRVGTLPPQLVRTREILDRQLRHLAHLVDDLLEVSRITQGKVRLHRRRVALSECVRDALHAARPALEASDHELEVQADATDPLYANADATRITQAVVNLLNNASKFTPAGGRITVSTAREGEQAVIRVSDTGIGIAPQHLQGIFNMFSQVSSARERSHGGLGIGLALVRGFVELHGGTVEAHSAGLGQGSEFVIRLPLLHLEEQAVPDTRPVAPVVRRRVLVIDDNHDAAASLAALLDHEGHEVRVAHNGPEGLAIAFESEPEFVLLDIGMPGMNGLDVARELRRRTVGSDVRLIAVTGWGQAQDRERTREAGFDYHLTKPVDHAELEVLLATGLHAPAPGEGERRPLPRH